MSSDSSLPQRGRSIPVFHTTTTHTTYPASSTSTTAAYGVLSVITIYYLVQYLEAHHLPLSELLWNTFVYVTPSKMLSLLDPKFSFSASQDPEDDKGHPSKGFDSQHHAAKSNSLRRLMGLDNNTGIMTVVKHTRTLSDLGSVFKKSRPLNSLPGLGNWDHSCYQNSVLQGLASLESLPRFLGRDAPEDEQGKKEEGPTRKSLRELMEKLNEEENVGKTFWTPSELKSMSSWQQQDAQEYFSKVMDGLEKDAVKAKKMRDSQIGFERLFTNDAENEQQAASEDMESTLRILRMKQLPAELRAVIMRNPLEGLLAQRVGCQQCGYVEGLSLVPFNCLTVPLGRDRMYDVRECLDEYTKLEPINEVECANCTLMRAKTQIDEMLSGLSNKELLDCKTGDNAQLASLQEDAQRRLDLIVQALEDKDFADSALKRCQIPAKSYVSTTKSRQAVVARPPEVLVIHINRSIFDEPTGEQSKNQASVRFPRRFDLGSWCLGTKKENPEVSIENWNTNPRQSMLDDVVDDQGLRTGPSYELRAVVTHYGRHENGHYICYRRSPHTVKIDNDGAISNTERSKPWWRLSDEEVTAVSEETVLAQGGVFMLFYEQVPSHGRISAPIWEKGPDRASVVNAEQVQTLPHEGSNDAKPATIKPESEDGIRDEPRVSSVYPTPPPEEFEEDSAKLETKSSSQDQSQPTKETPQPNVDAIPAEERFSDLPSPIPTPTDLTPPTNSTDANGTYHHLSTEGMPLSETTPVVAQRSPSSNSALPPKPISPRTGRENGMTTTGKAMLESMAGFVQAN